MSQNPESVAAQVGRYLEATDQRFLNLIGIEVEEVLPGQARCTLVVREEMLNSGQFCHGGFIFFLADTSFAYAALASNQAMVTLSAHVMYTQAAKLGDTLIATARMVTASGRTNTGDVEITNQDGVIIARFQGVAYRLKQAVIPEIES